jgi:rubredoxin
VKPLATSSRIDATTRLECRICWYVYDPAEGDALEQIPPGTAFADLPDHWRCPQCDAAREMFLPLAKD